MGRSPCCEKVGLKKGPWTPEEDQKLLAYIEEHSHGSWRALPSKAGLQRCGKSCRLRWTNYLRPDIKRGKFSIQEEQTIIQLHALLGNRWSAIATHLPKRTDNEIKNYWNTHLKKRLTKMGIDPVTHKSKSDTLNPVDGHSKNAANLSHMAQWESARLEAEARLVRESKIRSASASFQQLGLSVSVSASGGSGPAQLLNKMAGHPAASALCLDVLKAWKGGIRPKATKDGTIFGDLESPTSTLSYSENSVPVQTGIRDNSYSGIEFMGNSSTTTNCAGRTVKEESEEDWNGKSSAASFPHDEYEEKIESFSTNLNDVGFTVDDHWTTLESTKMGHGHEQVPNFVDGFTDLLLGNLEDKNLLTDDGRDGGEDYEENNNYWNSILNLVNSSPSESPVF